ncbi:helix-turn-helix domain-containing protein [Dactylosporangium sp. McL0621]|uniref:helix-turn-helix domain-containing protein n=1 Tax=Dactylosporangium sp. McL0621 TaxID=3415678 RepID=UPI003CF2C0CB
MDKILPLRAVQRAASGVLPPKALYRIAEAMELLSLSRTVIYEQIRAGRLRTVTQGRTRLVPSGAIADYVALLERESLGRAA